MSKINPGSYGKVIAVMSDFSRLIADPRTLTILVAGAGGSGRLEVAGRIMADIFRFAIETNPAKFDVAEFHQELKAMNELLAFETVSFEKKHKRDWEPKL